MTLSALRRFCYALARGIGDDQTIRKGPQAVVKRMARRQAWRMTGGC